MNKEQREACMEEICKHFVSNDIDDRAIVADTICKHDTGPDVGWRQLALESLSEAEQRLPNPPKLKQLRQRAEALDHPECAHQWTDTRNTTSGIQTCMKCGIMRPQ